MLYHIETAELTAGQRTSTVYTLSRPWVGSLAEIWPAHGFNCLRWQVRGRDLLFVDPDWQNNPVPTRSGIPILFPFPNRIRNGVFRHEGREYALPTNDASGKNAIHGFSPRNPWRVFGYGADADAAWLHGDFQLSADAPDADRLWPGDGLLSVFYRLSRERLRMDMRVRNTGTIPFPFGLGLHPYLRLPNSTSNVSAELLHAPARSFWPLRDSLPTGDRAPVTDDLNWNRPRRIGTTTLDTVYTNLGVIREEPGGFLLRATLSHPEHPGALEVWTTADFRESVLFTPVHRQAVCIEPYTCTTDAVNLDARGVDAGWRTLDPGREWTGAVEFRWNPAA